MSEIGEAWGESVDTWKDRAAQALAEVESLRGSLHAKDEVIESLREQLENERWLRNMAITTADELRVECEAAEAKLDRAVSQRGTLRWALNEAEAKLADSKAETQTFERVAAERKAKLAEVRDQWQEDKDSWNACAIRLAEVEKERDELRVLRRKEQKRAEDLQVSMDRARELAEQPVKVGVSSRLEQIARLLGGDDEPK